MTSEVTLSILDLPPEVREPIWKLVDCRSAARSRFVCRQFREDVDTFCSSEQVIYFATDKSHIARVLEVRTDLLQILNFAYMFPDPNWNWKDFALSVPPTRSTVLKYPKALRTLWWILQRREGDFNEEHAGNIFDNLITSSAINLTKLVLFLDEDQLYQFSHPGGWSFGKLKTLKLSLHTKCQPDANEIKIPQESNLFLQMLAQSPMPELRNISLTLHLWSTGRRLEALEILEAYLSLVDKDSRKLLRKFSIAIRAKCNMIDLMTADFEAIQRKFKGVLQVNYLQKLDISDNTNRLTDFWRRLILNQKGLQIMKLKLGDYGHLQPFRFYQQLILHHADSLVKMEIEELQDFDLSVLSNCGRLKSLTLSRIIRISNPEQDQPDLVDLHKFPQTLTKLAIFSFLLLSSDLLSLFGSNHLPRLEVLWLYRVGHWGSFGVTAGVLPILMGLGKGRLTMLGIAGPNVTNISARTEVEANWNDFGCKVDFKHPEDEIITLIKNGECRWVRH